MKILLIGNYEPDRQYSMLNFGRLLASELRKVGHAVRLVQPAVVLGRYRKRGGELSKWLGYADKFLLFPQSLPAEARGADVVHICDQAYASYTRYLANIPHIVTCHDLIAIRSALGEIPERHTRWSGRQYQRMNLNGLIRARHVACVSETTQAEFLRIARVNPVTTSVVYNALNFDYRPVTTAERAALLHRLGIFATRRFILFVGSNAWYKNLGGLLRTFHELASAHEGRDLAFVMVTGELPNLLQRFIRDAGLAPKLKQVSDVRPEDLRAIYSSATALIFPSLYEGFGWPIVEAQACGCPVFTSDRAPMTEVGGNAAVYFNPEDPKKAARIILENLAHTSTMSEAGFVNVRRFSAAKMVAGYLNAYREAIGRESCCHSRERVSAA